MNSEVLARHCSVACFELEQREPYPFSVFTMVIYLPQIVSIIVTVVVIVYGSAESHCSKKAKPLGW